MKAVPRTAFRKWAKTFGLVEGRKLLLESDGELTILLDFLIYHHRQRGTTLVQKYLATLPPSDDPDETLVRQAMAGARYSMFEVLRAHSFTGVAVHDLVRGGRAFVVDEMMSTSMKPGQLLASRLLPLPDYWMTGGAGVPLSPEVVEIVKRLFLPTLEMMEGDASAHLSPEAEDELASVVIGAAMRDGTAGDIEFK